MQVEIGKIYEGTVKNITKYGAFVEIPNPDGDKIMGLLAIDMQKNGQLKQDTLVATVMSNMGLGLSLKPFGICQRDPGLCDRGTAGACQSHRHKSPGQNQPFHETGRRGRRTARTAPWRKPRRAQRQTVPWKRRCTPRTAVPSATPQQAQRLGAEKAAGTLRDDLRGYALPVQAEQRRADVRHQAQHRAQEPFQAEIRTCKRPIVSQTELL